MNIVQLIKRFITYLMSHLVYNARNPICVNGSKPERMQEVAVLLGSVVWGFLLKPYKDHAHRSQHVVPCLLYSLSNGQSHYSDG